MVVLPCAAARIAYEAGAKRLVLTHFDAAVYQSLPERKESEAVAAGIFPAARAAVDGLELTL
jgi:ribonuclease BN (tRNA processing enzyme)